MSEEAFIGTDIISVPRIAAILKRHPRRFQYHTFTEREIAYCSSTPAPEIHYAGRFAAKEAVKKALLSSGIIDNITLKQIEIVRQPNGAPTVNLDNDVPGQADIKLSISHTDDYATATALFTMKDE